MTKTILITGATDGIGLRTAQTLAGLGHSVLLHGRSAARLAAAQDRVGPKAQTYLADLSDLDQTRALAKAVAADHPRLDVLINNAGVFKTARPRLADGQDVRFVVNTVSPIVLTQALLANMPLDGRVLNLSSAAQAPVDLKALRGENPLEHMQAYAQSKLALTIWTQAFAQGRPKGPVTIAVNPGSLLASKMVHEGFGVAGGDLSIGAEILCRLALDANFKEDTGKYWDNDAGRFASPHGAAQDPDHVQQVLQALADLTTESV